MLEWTTQGEEKDYTNEADTHSRVNWKRPEEGGNIKLKGAQGEKKKTNEMLDGFLGIMQIIFFDPQRPSVASATPSLADKIRELELMVDNCELEERMLLRKQNAKQEESPLFFLGLIGNALSKNGHKFGAILNVERKNEEFRDGEEGENPGAEREENPRCFPTQTDPLYGSPQVTVVTGANRGIGYEIARQLAVHGLRVVVTTRDMNHQESTMKEQGLDVVTHHLDITVPDSVHLFARWIQERYGGLDILVNNAGVNFNIGSENSAEYAETVIETNYYGTKRMIEAMIPLMKPSPCGSRIVNVSSRLGKLNGRRNRVGDAILREQLADVDTLSKEVIESVLSRFLEEVKHGDIIASKWPQMFTDYSLSKMAVNMYTRLMARTLHNGGDGHQIYMNCYCPGWVKTAMSGWMGNLSVELGADTGVWLALLHPSQSVSGNFFAERREINF